MYSSPQLAGFQATAFFGSARCRILLAPIHDASRLGYCNSPCEARAPLLAKSRRARGTASILALDYKDFSERLLR